MDNQRLCRVGGGGGETRNITRFETDLDFYHENHVVAREQSDRRNRIDKQKATNWFDNAITTLTTCRIGLFWVSAGSTQPDTLRAGFTSFTRRPTENPPRNDMQLTRHSEQSEESITPTSKSKISVLPPVEDMKKRFAFTLAEVLITLGIIGVVAAMTIPTLVSNYRQKSYVVQWRKTYSDVSNSLRRLQGEDETLPYDFASEQDDAEYDFLVRLTKYMKVDKVCHSRKMVEEGCVAKNYNFKYLNNTNGGRIDMIGAGSSTALLPSGTLLIQDERITYVDINNSSPPNQVGKDIYAMWINIEKYEARPAKGHKAGYGAVDGVNLLSTSGDGTCDKTVDYMGYGCSYWYLHHMP